MPVPYRHLHRNSTVSPDSGEFHVSLVYSPLYQINLDGLEDSHPFDIKKLSRIYSKLVEEGYVSTSSVIEPEGLSDQDIRSVHTDSFFSSLDNPHFISTCLESPIISNLPPDYVRNRIVHPFRCIAGGTIGAARAALESGIGINIGGGFHHAKPEKGEGFCIFADIPIAIRSTRHLGGNLRTLIIDLDVHQGNGLAVCHKNDNDVFIFSMHQGNIYPIPKEQSDLDIQLNPGTNDEQYIRILKEHLPAIFNQVRPQIVFYVAGCDTSAEDPLASLEMTARGINCRDLLVIDHCASNSVPVAMTLGGGYSPHAWEIQYETIRRIIEKYGLCSLSNYSPL